MTISKERLWCKLTSEEQIIEQVMYFIYFGIIVSSARDTQQEVRNQFNKSECRELEKLIYILKSNNSQYTK